MNNKYIYPSIFAFTVILLACVEHNKQGNEHNVRVDFRFGNRFYSLCSKETGEFYAIKGKASDYNDSFTILSADTSSTFLLDSAKVFYKKISDLSSKSPIIDHKSDAPRVEIYYDKKKIYDTHKWDEGFWDTFRPIMTQLPKGFNPFFLDEKPFG